MHPRKFIRDSFGIALAQYVVRATLMIRTLVAARLMGPGPLGAWNAIQILIDNGNLPAFGTQQGLDQMVPPRIVADDPVGLARVKAAALINILATTAVYAVGSFVWTSVRSSKVFDAWGPVGLLCGIVCVFTTNVANYQTSIMRSHGDFSTVRGWMVLQGAVGGVLGLALTPWLGMWGLLVGWVLGCVVAFVYSTAKSTAHAPLLALPSRESLELVRIGFPMFMFLASSQIMRQLDRLIILRFLGTESLGLYSLAVMALTLLLYLPDAVTYVLYPQLLRLYGEAGHSADAIRPRVERLLKASSVLVPALAAVAFLFARPAALLLLPRFMPGVPALRALCFGAIPLAFANFASVVLMTVRRQLQLIPAAIASILVGVVLDIVAVRLGWGITGVAWMTLATYTLNGMLMLALALNGLEVGWGRVALSVVRMFAPGAVALGTVQLLERFMPWATSPDRMMHVVRLALATLAFGVIYGVLVKPFTRGMGLRLVLSELNLPVVGPLLRRLGVGADPRDPE